jgi:hypothetical protein
MDGGSGPDAKKARWSPTSPSQTGRPVDPFANYGYGPNASIQQQQAGQAYGSSPSSPLYATPNLSINTNAAASSPVVGAMPSPNSAAFQQPGQASPINGNGQYGFGYNMIMPGMLNGFAYNGQMQGFNGQVLFFFLLFFPHNILRKNASKTLPPVVCPSSTSLSPKHRIRHPCLALP